MWLKEHARIHHEGKDAHLQPQKTPRYPIAGSNGWIRSHRKLFFWEVSQCPSSSNGYCLIATQGRPRIGHFLVGPAACRVCVTQHKRQACWSGEWDPKTTMRSSARALDLPQLLLGSKVLRQQPWDHRLPLGPGEELASPGGCSCLTWAKSIDSGPFNHFK